MGPFSKEFLFCNHCKAELVSIEEMYFVEEGRTRGFCSENCIESFFKPTVNHYESLDKKLRKERKLDNEDSLRLVGVPKYMEAVIRRPSEIWCLTNNLGENVYAFIATLRDDGNVSFEMIILCTVLDNHPSFIFLATATRNKDYLALFRIGEEIKDREHFLDNKEENEVIKGIDQETLELIESKKSKHLAILLEKMGPADIPFEEFMNYDIYLSSTLQDPDEIYRYKDEDGDDIIVAIKALEKDHLSFYYFVVSLLDKDPSYEEGQAMYPIISFPSNDGEIYHAYKKGTQISGALKS